MRAPLGCIIVFIDLLLKLKQCEAQDRKRARSYYKQVKLQAQLMLHFVNDLLDYSLIKQQKFKRILTKFDPNQIFKYVM